MECTGHSHDHDHEDDSLVSLHPYISLQQVYCLNESIPNSGAAILKSYSDRLSREPSLRNNSNLDDEEEDIPELLLHVPFTEAVKMTTICIKGGTCPPKTVKIVTNRNDLDFETVRDLDPDLTLELVPPQHEEEGTTLDYPLRPAGRFQNVSSIDLYFFDNASTNPRNDHSVAPTEITYIGFKGRGTHVKRRAVETVYESRGMKRDHQVRGDEYGMGRFV